MTKAQTRQKVYDALTGDRMTTSEVAERAGLGVRTVQEHLRDLVRDQTTEVFPGDDGTNPNRKTYYRRDRQTMAQRMSAKPQDIQPKPSTMIQTAGGVVQRVSDPVVRVGDETGPMLYKAQESGELPPLATEVMTVSPEGTPTFTPVDDPKDPPAPPESPSPQSGGTGDGRGQPMRASLGLDPEFLPEARDDEFEGDPTIAPTFGNFTNPH